MQWAVSVTTAPRPTPTLSRTLASLRRAGFAEATVLDDAGRDGAWPNWLQAVRVALAAHPAGRSDLDLPGRRRLLPRAARVSRSDALAGRLRGDLLALLPGRVSPTPAGVATAAPRLAPDRCALLGRPACGGRSDPVRSRPGRGPAARRRPDRKMGRRHRPHRLVPHAQPGAARGHRQLGIGRSVGQHAATGGGFRGGGRKSRGKDEG